MMSKKITLNELRKIVKEIIVEIDDIRGYNSSNGDEEFERREAILDRILGVDRRITSFDDVLEDTIRFCRKDTNFSNEEIVNAISKYLKKLK